jgi:hypothetical protein
VQGVTCQKVVITNFPSSLLGLIQFRRLAYLRLALIRRVSLIRVQAWHRTLTTRMHCDTYNTVTHHINFRFACLCHAKLGSTYLSPEGTSYVTAVCPCSSAALQSDRTCTYVYTKLKGEPVTTGHMFMSFTNLMGRARDQNVTCVTCKHVTRSTNVEV